VYKDIADLDQYKIRNLTYPDLCSPSWLEDKDYKTFYGFHGSCFNAYKDIKPHEGYYILKKWKETIFDPKLPLPKIKKRENKKRENGKNLLRIFRFRFRF